jgi:hypothetical protein
MKLFFTALCFSIVAVPSFASSSILIDASCKVSCLVGVTEVINSQGVGYTQEYANVYMDVVGVTREQLDKKTLKSELNKVCTNEFSEKAVGSNVDCLTFKH